MKKFAILMLALVVSWISYALAQQPIEVPGLVPPAPVALVATDHPPLPKDVSQYWFVPRPSRSTKPEDSFSSLARGVKAITAGEYATGLALVSRPSLGETYLNDYARYYQALALQGLSRLPEADTTLTALVASTPEGYLSQVAKLKLAEVILARPDAARAERLLREITAETGASEDAWMLLGEAEEALNHRDHAIEAYRKVYYGFPLSGRAPDAKTGLDRLKSPVGVAGGVPPGDELARAERLFAGRRWAEAKVALEPLVNVVSGSDRELVSLHLAEADFHLGQNRAARDRLKPYLDDSSKEPEARYYYLSAVRGLGDRATYVNLSRALVKDYPDSPWAAEALDDLASYYVIDDQDDEADQVFRELLDRFPRHRYAERAAWKVGWSAYRSRKFAETVKVFESAAATFPRADYRPAWIYWSGRARDRVGDVPGAVARYGLAVTDYGNSYYGRLASRLLASRQGADAAVVAPSAPPVTSPETRSAPATESLMQALMTAGLFDDALREVQFAQRTWGDSPALQATSAWIRAQQARELRAEERFAALRGSITTMRRAYPQFLSAEGHTLPVEVLRIIFPLEYWDLIEKYSKAKSLDPYLVSALMAQESTFTAEIRSSANARGLMQVMPGTGRLYARRMGIRPFTTASLSQPETNVKIGIQYFKDLVDKFGGIHYALAGYNAGDARVAEWIRDTPDLAQDEFIDSIPFPETQNYVKRILGTTEDYRRLYGTGLLTPGGRPNAD